MKVVWLSWKDHLHPTAGGAEVVKRELCRRLVGDGHEVIILTAAYAGSKKEEKLEGSTIIRVGNRFSVYYHAWCYYKKNLMGWADVVIDECNTVPFFARFYSKQRTVLFVHQLARQIWFYELPLPLSIVGYILEPIYLWALRKSEVITVSQSSKADLLRIGFKTKNINIISEGLTVKPVSRVDMSRKAKDPTLLIFGAVRSMKRTLHGIKAFELAKADIPNLKLLVAGKPFGRYGKKVEAYVKSSPYAKDITYLGAVDTKTRHSLMRQAHYIVVTSVKEGWGLIVSEAGAMGTPAIVYDVDGLRDAVGGGKYGVLSKTTVEDLRVKIAGAPYSSASYAKTAKSSLVHAETLTFDKSYQDFISHLDVL